MKWCAYILILTAIMSCGTDIDETIITETSNVKLSGKVINQEGLAVEGAEKNLFHKGLVNEQILSILTR